MKTKKNMKCLLGMVFMIMSALNVSAASVTYSVTRENKGTWKNPNYEYSWTKSSSNAPEISISNNGASGYVHIDNADLSVLRIYTKNQYNQLSIQLDNGSFKYHVSSVKISYYCPGNYKIDGHMSVEPLSGATKSTDFTEDFTSNYGGFNGGPGSYGNSYDVQLTDFNGINNIKIYANKSNEYDGFDYYAYIYIKSITIDYDVPSIKKIDNAPSEMTVGDVAEIFEISNLGAYSVVYTTDPDPNTAFSTQTVDETVTMVTAQKVGTATLTGTIEGYSGTNNSASHTITVKMPSAEDLISGNTVSVRADNGIRIGGTSSWITKAWRHEQVPLTLQLFSSVNSSGVPTTSSAGFAKGVNNTSETEKLSIYATSNSTKYMVLSLPRGYRILGYEMGVTRKFGSAEVTGSANITRYFDNFSSTSSHKSFDRDTWLTANGGIEESFSDAHNTLYFEFSDNESNAYYVFDNFTINYVVDEEFTETFPSEDGKSYVETGIVDFGTTTGQYHQYTQSNVTTTQLVKVYKEGDTDAQIDAETGRYSNVSYFDGCYAVSSNGNYIVEAPQGYRITAANVTFKMAPTGSITSMIKADEDNTYCPISPYEMNHTNESGANLFDNKYKNFGTYPTTSGSETKWCSKYEEGKTFLIFDATVPCKMDNYTLIDAFDTFHFYSKTEYFTWRHWLKWDIYGGNFNSFADAQEPDSKYAAEDDESKRDPDYKKGAEKWNASWHKIGEFTDSEVGTLSGRQDTKDRDDNITKCYYNSASGTAATSRRDYDVDDNVGAYRFYRIEVTGVGNPDDPTVGGIADVDKGTPKQQMAEMIINFLGNGHTYTVTLPDGTTRDLSEGVSEITTAIKTPDGTSENLNNDAIKININGLPTDMSSNALFKVDLTLIPLDPHIQNVNVIATGQTADGKMVENNLRRLAYDFEFKDVNIVVPEGSTDYKLSVTDADNEQGIDAGKSNYFLIGSRYSNNLPTLNSGARQTISSNILDTETFGDKPELVGFESTGDDGYVLTDKDYASIKESAKWTKEKDLTETATPYYMYVADYPLYNISNTPHIAYRFYKVNAKVTGPDVETIVDATTLQEVPRETTLNSDQFEMTRYVGLKIGVGSNIYGYTGPCYISDGKGHYLSSTPTSTGDQKVGRLRIATENPTLWYLEKNGTYYRLYYMTDDNNKHYLGIWNGSNGELQIYTDNVPDQYVNWEVDELGQMYVHLGNQYCTLSIGADWFSSTPANLPYTEDSSTHEKTSTSSQYAQLQATTFTSDQGNVSSSYVIDAIKEKLTNSNYEFKVAGNTSDADRYKGVLYVDMGGLSNVTETKINEVSDWVTFQDAAAKNCLFFMSSKCSSSLEKNVISKTEVGSTDLYLVSKDYTLTDAEPFSNPYDFNVTGDNKLSYTRTLSTKWSTAFLPFPVKNNTNGVKYYYLYAASDKKMVFRPYADDAEIPANTPVMFYSEDAISVNYQNGTVSNDDDLDLVTDVDAKTYNSQTNSVGSQTVGWQFIGTRFDKYIYSTTNSKYPNGLGIEQCDNVYFFSNNTIHYINPNGRVMFSPFRAYMKPTNSSSAKTLSFIIFDENDGSTDITDIINGDDTAGDGKMYDLYGRRIMTPIKGQIYIVDGKKKIY